MAYFPNGTSGMIFDEQCSECIHEDPTALCPIANVQMEYNYFQCNKGQEKLRECMNFLVNEKGYCQMKIQIEKYYRKKPYPGQEQKGLF